MKKINSNVACAGMDVHYKFRTPDLCENEVSPNQPPGAGNSGAPRLNLMVNFVPGYL